MDGYRAIAVKADRRVNLFSRRRKSFDHHYPLLVEALGELPEGTVVDGEVVALDESGRPNFNLNSKRHRIVTSTQAIPITAKNLTSAISEFVR